MIWDESKEYQYTASFKETVVFCCRYWDKGKIVFGSQRKIDGETREIILPAPHPSQAAWKIFCDAADQYCKRLSLAEEQAFDELLCSVTNPPA